MRQIKLHDELLDADTSSWRTRDRRGPKEIEIDASVTSNPYAPPNGIREFTPNGNWSQQFAATVAARFSAYYVVGSIVGVVCFAAFRAGIWTVFLDTATVKGGVFFAVHAVLAAGVSVLYCPKVRYRRFELGRLIGGVAFGFSSMLSDPYVGHLARSYPDWIASSGHRFVLSFFAGVSVSIFVQVLFRLFMGPSAQSPVRLHED